MNTKNYLAELIASFLFIFIISIGCIITLNATGELGLAMLSGFSLIALTYAFGHVSGSHINPIVSLGYFTAGRMKFSDLVGYVIAQSIGTIIATLLTMLLFGYDAMALTTNTVSNGFTYMQGAMVELFISFLFVTIILSASTSKGARPFVGLITGFSLIASYLVLIPLNGASLNPIRSIATVLFSLDSGALTQLPIFIVAPLAGSLLAGLLWKFILAPKPERG